MIAAKDRNIIRDLAVKWAEFASQPVMSERKRLWTAVHDLKSERPVILVETQPIDGFVSSSEILCEDPYLRAVERNMRDTIRHAEEVGDDIRPPPPSSTSHETSEVCFKSVSAGVTERTNEQRKRPI